MNETMNQAQAADRMMEEIKTNHAVKAAMRTQHAEDVREAMEDSKDVAMRIAAGDVAPSVVSEPVSNDPTLFPETEAVEGARMIDDLLQHASKRRARHEATVISYKDAVRAQARAARHMAGTQR